MSDVLEVRCALDVLAVELACERITSEAVEELREACREFEKATVAKDVHVIA
jgi:DNA-binding FadR family transcriptional regulator